MFDKWMDGGRSSKVEATDLRKESQFFFYVLDIDRCGYVSPIVSYVPMGVKLLKFASMFESLMDVIVS